MVVDLTVHRQDLLVVGREQRLSTALGVYDAQTFVGKDCRSATIDTTPVGPAMTQFLTHAQRLLSQFGRLLFDVEDRYDSTHIQFTVNSLFNARFYEAHEQGVGM